MQLTKKASEFWIKRMLMSDVIGFDKQQEIYSALMKDGDSTRIFEDPFTGCEIDIKTEILQKIYSVRY
ncbi:MAG: hypothetical protein HOP31_15680 [Ignavibacteria bacterium]|nr:hypothetical protein [Ignavibacteria bacterium]